MAKITLDGVQHSYMKRPEAPDDWALKKLDLVWSDGGAYGLLGPSGCGKSTLLNVISGLQRPSHGRVFFDDRDMTDVPSAEREIAQVFQFPVVYETMTVFDNLAFPLRNCGFPGKQVKRRALEIAHILDLEAVLDRKASGLASDYKQKISLGRGLVRADVNVIMFDEPLTVIDPHAKWVLSSKLKELHQALGATMIYVTHDQSEALTFADKVVVMHEGVVVQIGTPRQLIDRPNHTFVGHFIGSPGMNLLPCQIVDGFPEFFGYRIDIATAVDRPRAATRVEIGVRPEFLRFAPDGLPVNVTKVTDVGASRIVEVEHMSHTFKVVTPEHMPIPSGKGSVVFDRARTHVYADGWIIT